MILENYRHELSVQRTEETGLLNKTKMQRAT